MKATGYNNNKRFCPRFGWGWPPSTQVKDWAL